MADPAILYGIAAEFPDARSLYEAAHKVRDAGYRRWDVFSPFPIHGMDAAMGLGRSWVSLLSLIGGTVGAFTAFFLIYYTGYLDYPTVVQGKPFFAFEPTFPIFFELAILLTAFATFFGMWALNLLPRLNHPMFNYHRFTRVTDDGFFLAIEAADPLFSETGTKALLEGIGGTHVTFVHEDAAEEALP